MAKLLTAINDPALRWYPKWIEINKSRKPEYWIKDGTIKDVTI